MKYLLPALAAVALTVPTTAFAATAGDEPTEASDAGDNSQNRIVCKRQKLSGSRLKAKKVCMSAAEWAQLKRDQREATERTQNGRWKSE